MTRVRLVAANRQAIEPAGRAVRHLLGATGLDASLLPVLVTVLETAVRSYEIEYRAFLACQRRQPPTDLAVALAAAFRRLAVEPQLGTAVAFRIAAAEAHFHAAERLFERETLRRERDA